MSWLLSMLEYIILYLHLWLTSVSHSRVLEGVWRWRVEWYDEMREKKCWIGLIATKLHTIKIIIRKHKRETLELMLLFQENNSNNSDHLIKFPQLTQFSSHTTPTDAIYNFNEQIIFFSNWSGESFLLSFSLLLIKLLYKHQSFIE